MAVHCNRTINVYCWYCHKAVTTVLMTYEIHVINNQDVLMDTIVIKQLWLCVKS